MDDNSVSSEEKYFSNYAYHLTTHVIPQVERNDTSQYDSGDFSSKYPFRLRFGMRDFRTDSMRILLDTTDINLTFEAAQELYFALGNAIIAVEVDRAEALGDFPIDWSSMNENNED